MKKTIIGVDYSLKSPAVTIYTKDAKLIHFAFPRRGTLHENYILTLRNAEVIVTEVDDCINVKSLQENERVNSRDAEMLAKTLCETIASYVDEDPIFVIEGISFASPGNKKIQYAGYHYVLRHVIHNYFNIDYEDIFVYAPMSVKMTAGKGNYQKTQMIEAFIISNHEEFKDNKLQQQLKDPTTRPMFQSPKAHNYVKPLDDIVDSYWTMRTYIEKH